MMLAWSSATMFGAVAAAMLRTSGGVSVNGSPVTPVTTVFSGDRIETAPNAAGSLSFNGSSLLLDQNSNLVFRGQEMDFACGGGTVQTSQGLSTHFGELAVTPAKDSARYRVEQSGATLKVEALEGDVNISQAGKSFNLPQGSSMNLPYGGCTQMAKSELPNNVKAADANANPPEPQNTPTPTPTPVGAGHAGIALAVAPAVVVSVGLAGIIAVSQNPVSSSGP